MKIVIKMSENGEIKGCELATDRSGSDRCFTPTVRE